MATLAQLYLAHPASDAYRRARQKAIKRCAAYIRPYLKHGIEATRLAEHLVSCAEVMGRIHGDTFSGEVASIYTRDSRPLPFTC